jgi:hypothetical protein
VTIEHIGVRDCSDLVCVDSFRVTPAIKFDKGAAGIRIAKCMARKTSSPRKFQK